MFVPRSLQQKQSESSEVNQLRKIIIVYGDEELGMSVVLLLTDQISSYCFERRKIFRRGLNLLLLVFIFNNKYKGLLLVYYTVRIMLYLVCVYHTCFFYDFVPLQSIEGRVPLKSPLP